MITKNKSPIILNCFSRGGSNILWNIFISHPEVCHPLEETVQIFSLNLRSLRFEGLKLLMLEKQKIFNQWDFDERIVKNSNSLTYIDNTLYNKKLKNYYDKEMRYKTESDIYNMDEIKDSRLVIKNNNGLIFCSSTFSILYPNATHVGLIRNPIALYESHKRRRTPVSKSIELFISYYRKMVSKMEYDCKTIKNYNIIKFEDILSNPNHAIRKLYGWANLDIDELNKIRLKSKPYMRKKGRYYSLLPSGKHFWYDFEDLDKFLDLNVNDNQITMLSQKEIKFISNQLSSTIEKYGYNH